MSGAIPGLGGGGVAWPRFQVTDIASLVVWYDFSDLSTMWTTTAKTTHVANDEDPIGYIANKANPGTFDLQQSTAANRPLYRDGDGFPYADFISHDSLSRSGAVPLKSAACCAYVDSSAGVNAGLVSNTADQDSNGDTIWTRVGNTWLASTVQGSALFSSSRMWRNGVQTTAISFDSTRVYSGDSTGFSGTSRLQNGIMLGYDRNKGSNDRYLVGRIYNVALFSEILSDGERALVEQWMAGKGNVEI